MQDVKYANHAGQEKRINLYRLQYWLYAVFAKRYGMGVKLKRDSLHHIYEANRHGFTVGNIESKVAEKFLAEVLLENGYELVRDFGSPLYKKVYEYDNVTIEAAIALNHGYWDGLYVFPMLNKHKKKK